MIDSMKSTPPERRGRRRVAVAGALLMAAAMVLAPRQGRGAEYYDAYDLKPGSGTVDLGVQPMAYPLAFISSVLRRDALLVAELGRMNLSLRTFAFRKGNDMVQLIGNGRLEAAMLGDLPTVNSAVAAPISVVGLGKRNFSSIVAHDVQRVEELRGRQVGYSAGSSSHLVLLRGLRAANLDERDVTLVPLEPSQMPDALEEGRIAAFSAWEPTPAISLNRNPRNRAIYRGMSTDWFILSRDFAGGKPEAALQISAAYARAINWMRASPRNLELATTWVFEDGRAFTGELPRLTRAAAMDIARNDLLSVPGAPAVPSLLGGAPPLTHELEFLKELGKVPAGVDASLLRDAFEFRGLATVMTDPRRYRLREYDYRADGGR